MSKRFNKNRKSTNLDACNDQFTDFDSVDDLLNTKSRIIFSEKAYKNLHRLIVASKIGVNNNPGHEEGCFFYGIKLGKDTNQILIDSCSSDFTSSDGYISGGAADCNDVLLNDVPREIGNHNCLIHFHTHPLFGHYDVFSDIDLDIFEHLASQDFSVRNGISVFGLLASPNREERLFHNIQLSMIYCRSIKKIQGGYDFEYYRFPNICYIKNGKVYEVGRYERINSPVLSTRRYVRSEASVQAFGYNPTNNELIVDKEVGYIENGKIRFTELEGNNEKKR